MGSRPCAARCSAMIPSAARSMSSAIAPARRSSSCSTTDRAFGYVPNACPGTLPLVAPRPGRELSPLCPRAAGAAVEWVSPRPGWLRIGDQCPKAGPDGRDNSMAATPLDHERQSGSAPVTPPGTPARSHTCLDTSGDQAREQTGDVGTVLRGVEETVLTLANEQLQGPFDRVIVQGRPGNLQNRVNVGQCPSK